ncbi:MAG: murein L,D-transpeptidase family protein [Alphaproteobacteria bacterium]
MKTLRILSIIITIIGILSLGFLYMQMDKPKPVRLNKGKETVASVIAKIDSPAYKRWQPEFQRLNINVNDITYLKFIALKQEKIFEIWVRANNQWMKLRQMPILGASGGMGHKLKQGDWQVPEGLYKLDYFNPNSQAHLSLHINYPNADDKAWAASEGRRNLGGDIMVHGSRFSIGCLAMGNVGAEDIFWLVYKVGLKNNDIIISPYDMRKKILPFPKGRLGERYQKIKTALENF